MPQANGIFIKCTRCVTFIYRRPSDSPTTKNPFCSMRCYKKWLLERPLSDRFWPHVIKTEICWLWIGQKRGKYGYQYCGGGAKHPIMKSAHHLSWEIHNGPIPDELWVLHHCDVPLCVRPDHLFLGTAKDNAEDRDRKGRRRNQYS